MYTSTLEGCVLGFQLEKNNDWDRVEIVRIVSASQAISSSRAAVRRHCTPRAAVTYYVIAASTIFWRQSKRPSVSPRLPRAPPPTHIRLIVHGYRTRFFSFPLRPDRRPLFFCFFVFCLFFYTYQTRDVCRHVGPGGRSRASVKRPKTRPSGVRLGCSDCSDPNSNLKLIRDIFEPSNFFELLKKNKNIRYSNYNEF